MKAINPVPVGIDRAALKARLLARIDTGSPDECWPWRLAHVGGGYGQVKLGRTRHPAHRLMYFAEYGECPTHMVVMHVCDNPPCCNPAHLRLGTHRDNAIDCVSKGRHARVPPMTKLSPDQVRAIREIRQTTNLSQRKVAAMFGVTDMVVHRIETGKMWRKVA